MRCSSARKAGSSPSGLPPTGCPTLPPAVPVTRYDNALIVPGFIDTHVHYPQLPVIAAFGRTLLDWLDDYTYVAEQRFADPAFAAVAAEAFLDEALRHGTTTAMVYGTVHAAFDRRLFRRGACPRPADDRRQAADGSPCAGRR